MGTTTMGKVIVPAKIENLDDLYQLEHGLLSEDQVRRVEVPDALVPQLGLKPLHKRAARTAGGPASLQVYRAVRLTVQGRDCICDVVEIPDDLPVLIGQIPLEAMDWVVDSNCQRLIGNPEHGGEQMIDVFLASRRDGFGE